MDKLEEFFFILIFKMVFDIEKLYIGLLILLHFYDLTAKQKPILHPYFAMRAPESLANILVGKVDRLS